MKKYFLIIMSVFINILQSAFCAAEEMGGALNQSLKQPAAEPNGMSVIFALLVVILLIYITGLIYSKLNLFGAKAVREQLKNHDLTRAVVLSTTQLGQNKNLHVIEIDNKRYLIGATQNSINLIKELGDSQRAAKEPAKEEETIDEAIEVLYGDEQKELPQELEKVKEFDVHKKYL